MSEGFAHLTLDEISARLHCSKSTLYTVAAGKEDLVRAVTVHFFRAATDAVESAVAAETAPPRRVAVYLEAVGDRLSAASSQFMEDLAESVSASQVYEKNTSIAADRVRSLIVEGVDSGRIPAGTRIICRRCRCGDDGSDPATRGLPGNWSGRCQRLSGTGSTHHGRDHCVISR